MEIRLASLIVPQTLSARRSLSVDNGSNNRSPTRFAQKLIRNLHDRNT
jgi:hypothetical protein